MTDRRFAVYLGALAGAIIAFLATLPGTSSAASAVYSGATGYVSHYEFCPGTASTTLPSSVVLSNRKSLTVQNLSSATCYAVFEPANTTTTPDPTNVVTTGKRGFKFGAGDIASFDFGPQIPMRAACTATTTTGACLQVMQAQ